MTDAAKTVFVIGAGASCEFGLPSGIGLKQQISTLLKHAVTSTDETLIFEAFERLAYPMQQPFGGFINAAKDISSSLPLAPSIDNYLHTHNGDAVVEQVGKLAIVSSILTAERKSHLYISSDRDFDFAKVEGTWLSKLMQLLNENSTIEGLKARLSSVVFIVFNYDRCIEHFLFHAIRVYYRVEPGVAADIVRGVSIYHPYGTVGQYPYTVGGITGAATDFGANQHAQQIIQLAKGIKTFTEGTDDESSDIIAIRKHILEASRLIFLGFAFHPINMELLTGKQEGRREGVSIQSFGTVFQTSRPNIDRINGEVVTQITNHACTLVDKTCSALFDEYSRTFRFQ